MIELVKNAETLRKIQVEHGLTGSFKDKPIAEWLAKYNPSELEYGRAVENFTGTILFLSINRRVLYLYFFSFLCGLLRGNLYFGYL